MFIRLLVLVPLTLGLVLGQSPHLRSNDGQNKFLGKLNANPLDPDSTSNPLGRYGSPLSPDSINNPLGVFGSPLSPYSATNPLATSAPKIVSPYGRYLGKLSSNPLDPDSTSNPLGLYGSPLSPDSINNPLRTFGSFLSPYSATNPLATEDVRNSVETSGSPELVVYAAWA